MSTVNFLCSYCNQLIAVSRDHLGQHVQCPQCQQVVQAPTDAPTEEAAAAEEGATEADFSSKGAVEQDSIFSAPQEELSEDVFGSSKKHKGDRPPELVPQMQLESTYDDSSQRQVQEQMAGDHTIAYLEPPPAPVDLAPASDKETPAPAGFADAGLAPAGFADAGLAPADSEAYPESALPRPSLRQPAKGGFLGTMLLIFLIPYALVTSGCVAYLIYLLNVERNKPAPFDPLERLPDPDPNPEKGGPKRVKHDNPLPDKLKVTLNQSLKIGDIEVTPLAIKHQGGSLKLFLKLHNSSTNTAFDPLPRLFVDFNAKKGLTANRPYTFLQVGDKIAYGGVLSYDSSPKRPGRFDGVLLPDETSVVVLETTEPFSKVAMTATTFPDKMLWRVQVRRGFVEVNGKNVSATALFGVEFGKGDILEVQGAQLTPMPQVIAQ